MFKVERLPEPNWMDDPEFHDVRARLRAFNESGGTRVLQERFDLAQELSPFNNQILDSLYEQFSGLSAYSEVRTDPDVKAPPHRLLWHRPTNDAASLDGRIHHEHYWWLTLAWENWYLASPFIESVKSYQFPVRGERSPLTEPAADRQLDVGLLLDPCIDEPAWWLRFLSHGPVETRQPPSADEQERFDFTDRAELTIRILDLNNEQLEQARFEARIDLVNTDVWVEPGAPIVDFVLDHLAHRGFLLQEIIRERVINRYWSDTDLEVDQGVLERLVERAPLVLGAELFDDANESDPLIEANPALCDELADHLVAEFPDIRDTDRFTELFAGRPLRNAPSPPQPKPAKRATIKQSPAVEVSVGPTDRIRRVLIKNFRAIRQVELTINAELVILPVKIDAARPLDENMGQQASPGTQWKVLLGENGSGKSSILHAIALALTGDRLDEFCAAAGLEWSSILRRTNDTDKNIQGRVLLEFTGGQRIDLRFNKSKAWFHGLAVQPPPCMSMSELMVRHAYCARTQTSTAAICSGRLR